MLFLNLLKSNGDPRNCFWLNFHKNLIISIFFVVKESYLLFSSSSVRLPRNIQILDENGENIVLMTNGDDSDDSDDEDREFTVIVEDDLG